MRFKGESEIKVCYESEKVWRASNRYNTLVRKIVRELIRFFLTRLILKRSYLINLNILYMRD